jgi:prophage regulatory protein
MILRYPDLQSKKGIPWSRMHIDRLEKVGKFPKRVHIGANTIGWIEDEIDAMIAAAAAERDGDKAA